MHITSIIFVLSSALLVSASPYNRRGSSDSFVKANGEAAKALQEKFKTLTADSPCTDGENACLSNGDFAQCANGKFVPTPCAETLTCQALPLVNSPGTSVTCDTAADAATRLANTGVKRELSFLIANVPLDRRSFVEENGKEAEALEQKFKTLTAESPCTDGENVCLSNGDFAQCANGKLVPTPCAEGLTCKALPLVNSAGTSVTCDTAADAATRIKNTGAKRTSLELAARDAVAPPACKSKGKRGISRRISKRIAQADLPAVAQSWQDLCLKSGGDLQTNTPCVTLAGDNGISSLLANADACAQQDNADAMVDFAKSKGVTNKQALIDNAIAYRKHPRNALNINGVTPSTPFCQKAPKNSELDGVVNGQLDGVDPGLFGSPKTGIVAFGDPSSCPIGKKPDVATCTCN
jgi:hypothetical protein